MHAERVFDQLVEVSLLLQADMAQSMSALGLTVTKTHLLWLVKQNGPSTQQRLAAELGVSPRHVTGLVDALQADGFAHRQPHPHDRRAVLVGLSSKGEATMSRLQEQRRRDAERLVTDLDADEVEQLEQRLDVVLGRLRHLVDVAAGDGPVDPR
jgi:DNA-binding MarR family transcriptional regulator